MLTKIFTVLLTVSILVMAFLTFYSWSWLGSIGAPASAATGYEYHAGISRGDVILEMNRKPVTTMEDVRSALESAGEKPILLLLTRGGQTVYVTVGP